MGMWFEIRTSRGPHYRVKNALAFSQVANIWTKAMRDKIICVCVLFGNVFFSSFRRVMNEFLCGEGVMHRGLDDSCVFEIFFITICYINLFSRLYFR